MIEKTSMKLKKFKNSNRIEGETMLKRNDDYPKCEVC